MKKINIEQRFNGPLRFIFSKEEVIKDSLLIYGQNKQIDDDLFLCRCGKSTKQPFCEGSHKKLGFKADTNSKLEQNYKWFKIEIIKQGPIILEGSFENRIEDSDIKEEKVAFCRCGESKNKPFCDGAHANLESDDYSF